jgi:hypothetical protein
MEHLGFGGQTITGGEDRPRRWAEQGSAMHLIFTVTTKSPAAMPSFTA